MVAAAVGLQTRGWKPFASTFGAFLSRAYDFIRMAAISGADLKLCGSHVGVSIGPDGPSQMALEDIAAFRAVLDSVVLYPSDANQAVAAASTRCASSTASATCARPAKRPPCSTGPTRSSRSAAAARCARATPTQVTLIGAGITLHECLAAAEALAGEGRRSPGDRPLLGEAGRRRDAARGRRRDRASWSRSRTTGRRGGSARRSPASSPEPAPAPGWSASPSPSGPAAAPRSRFSPPPGSTPRTSSPRPRSTPITNVR